LTESNEKNERTPHMIYDSSFGLAVSWGEQAEETPGEVKKAISPEELARRQHAVAISGGWVFLTGDEDVPPKQ